MSVFTYLHLLWGDLVLPSSTPTRDPARQWIVERPEAQVRYDVRPAGAETSSTWTLLDVDDPGSARVGHMCKRINELINRDLRYSFGQ